MAVIVENNEIWLTGTVGAYWWDDGFTAVDVAFALAQIGRSTDRHAERCWNFVTARARSTST